MKVLIRALITTISALVLAITMYVGNRGICSGGRRLRVQWFPVVQPEGCV